jgi:hypothetical protein
MQCAKFTENFIYGFNFTYIRERMLPMIAALCKLSHNGGGYLCCIYILFFTKLHLF